MNWTQIEGKWDQLKGDVRSAWGKLTDDDIAYVGGKVDKLVGKIVERYGVKKEQAHQQVSEWADRLAERIDSVGRWREERPGQTRAQGRPAANTQDRPSTPRH